VDVRGDREHRLHQAAQGAVSLHTSTPDSSPSRTLMTATPCSPMGPLTITTSPGTARCGRMSTPSGITPMPAVSTGIPSPWPASTTLVSPVTTVTSAAAAAVPIARATRRTTGSPVPSLR